ncbi:MAG: HlyC/CorC family transporter [Deltaproteobacteria bacterium]|nr:HlyC/CorC family transporter [Deltaproteobacteria bacterium]
MSALAFAVVVLVAIGTMLALAEAALTRVGRVRAISLRQDGRKNAALLEEIETDLPRYLNAVYLAVLLAQNGSAILVALLAEQVFGALGVTLVSVGFTLAYFVLVEAMAKTFAVLHSDRVALLLAPAVWVLAVVLRWPTRALIGVANVLLPGKGLVQGPFVTPSEIRTMAEVGHEEGGIDEAEKEMIDSVFHFRHAIARQVMVPYPDVVGIDLACSIEDARKVFVQHGVSRLPVYRSDLDQTEGIVHAKDLLAALERSDAACTLGSILRPVHYVPESKRLVDLLKEMREQQFHMVLVIDEFGSVAGLVTLEDLLEELVGEIADEHDVDEEDEVERLPDGRFRVDATLAITDLSALLGVELPRERWNTVGGLMFGLLGAIPTAGETVVFDDLRFTAERVMGRRIVSVLIAREPAVEAGAVARTGS